MAKKQKKVCPCGSPSIPGLISDVSLCQKHYNALMFGAGDAHKEAVSILNRQK